MQPTKKFSYYSYFNPDRKSFWIITGILLKSLIFSFLIYQHGLHYGHQFFSQAGLKLYVEAFDTISYLVPIENLIHTGKYIQIPGEPFSQVVRMPGYGFLYMILRLMADANTAKNILVLLQIAVSGISVYYLAQIGYLVTKRPLVFYIVFILYGISAYVNMYDSYILTESLSTSSIIIAIYFLVKQRTNLVYRGRYIFFAGILLALSCFMRPVAVPIIGISAIYIFLTNLAFINKVKLALIFGLPFLIADTIWIIRNYAALSRFIPLQYNSWLHKTKLPVNDVEYYSYEWIRDVGEDNVFYEFNTLGAWLYKNSFVKPDYVLPPHIYASAYNQDSLYALREKFLLFWNNREQLKHTPEGDAKARSLNQTFDTYSSAYEAEHKVSYFIGNRLRLLYKFLFHSGTGQFPFPAFSQLSKEISITLFLKIGWSFLYWIIIVAGIISLPVFLIDYSYDKWLIIGIILYSILIFPFIIRVVELRYICLAYPFLTIGAGIVIERLISKINYYFMLHKKSAISD